MTQNESSKKRVAQWIALAVFIVRIICLAKPGRNDIPHRYSQNRAYKKSSSEVYGGIVQQESNELSHFRGRLLGKKKSQTKKLGFSRKAYITLSLTPNNVRLVELCKKQAKILKKSLFKYEMVRRTAKRLKVLKVPLHNANAYSINYLNKLKSGPWQGTREHLESVFPCLHKLTSRIVGRLESSRLATPILPTVGSKSKFAEMLVLQGVPDDQTDPRPTRDTAFYVSLMVVAACMLSICIHFFLSSQG